MLPSSINRSTRAAALAWVLVLLPLAAGLLALNPTSGGRDSVWRTDTLYLSQDDQPGYAGKARDEQAWARVSVAELGPRPGARWLRTEVELPIAAGPAPPFAVFLSGPFSATVYWDGEAIGAKGRPGAEASDEIPGPIDAVIHVPDDMATPGSHRLAIRVSSHHLGYAASNLIHELSVGAYQHDPRRRLRYYALPVLLSGVFVLLGFHLGYLGWRERQLGLALLGAMAAAVLLQLLGEVARALLAYAYDWHRFRSMAIWLAALAGGLCLNAILVVRSAVPRPWLWLGVLGLVAIGLGLLARGFDARTVRSIQVLALPSIGLALHQVFRGHRDPLLIASGSLGLAWLVVAQVSPADFLDRGYYFATAAYLTGAWLLVSGRTEQPTDGQQETRGSRPFVVRNAGRMERIPAGAVVALTAAGNYTELVRDDGSTTLHHLGLGQLMAEAPSGFARVHRSHAINLDRLQAVLSRPGSRYRARLDGGIEVPVSRNAVSALRERLEQRRET